MTEPRTEPLAPCHPDRGCITCGDAGTPVRVLRIDTDRGLALCADAEGAKSTIEIALVDPVRVGDTLLVHAGVALAPLDAEALA